MEYLIRDGKLQSYGLEIHAAEHCNLRCAGCAQSSPFLPPQFPDLKQLAESLSHLARVLHPQRATILGGEPLLNPHLIELLHVVRAAKMVDRVFVTTNGLLLPKVDAAFWGLVDTVEISVYPSTRATILAHLDVIFEQAWAKGTEVHLNPVPQFRHITVTTAIPNRELVSLLCRECYFKHYCHTVHQGKLYKCGPSTNINHFLRRANGACVLADSGIAIDGHPGFLNLLAAYFRDDRPLDACYYCLGSSGGCYMHTQLSAKDIRNPAPVPFSENLIGGPVLSKWQQWKESI